MFTKVRLAIQIPANSITCVIELARTLMEAGMYFLLYKGKIQNFRKTSFPTELPKYLLCLIYFPSWFVANPSERSLT